MKVAVWGINYKTASAEGRENVAVANTNVPELLKRLTKQFEEAVVISTCNRTEVYVVAKDTSGLKDRLSHFFLNGQVDKIQDKLYLYTDIDVAKHLFKVASSIDSMVVGETQILGQVKDAYKTALRQESTGKYLNQLFQHSFRVAKRIRTETNIARGNHSVSSVACCLAEEKLGNLKDKQVMIIGAGKIGETTLQYLVKKGIKAIFVGNRTFKKAEELTRRFGGVALHFKDCFEKMAECDLIICQTSSPHYIIRYENISNKRKRPQILLDLAIPRDIEPTVAELENIFLYNIDSLKKIIDKSLGMRKKESLKAEAIIEEELGNYTKK